MMTEPSFLLMPILRILKNNESSMSEHELITQLKPSLETLVDQSLPASLILFQSHFLVMNALYQLQQEIVEDNLYLHISALEIYLSPMAEAENSSVINIETDDALRSYYLDFSHFETTSHEDVEQLLNGFWKKYLTEDKKSEACSVLGLNINATKAEVQKAYRRLAGNCHPDKGGDGERFMAIREAYEILRYA
jgi:DnaJ-domain-containing protein 1